MNFGILDEDDGVQILLLDQLIATTYFDGHSCVYVEEPSIRIVAFVFVIMTIRTIDKKHESRVQSTLLRIISVIQNGRFRNIAK